MLVGFLYSQFLNIIQPSHCLDLHYVPRCHKFMRCSQFFFLSGHQAHAENDELTSSRFPKLFFCISKLKFLYILKFLAEIPNQIFPNSTTIELVCEGRPSLYEANNAGLEDISVQSTIEGQVALMASALEMFCNHIIMRSRCICLCAINNRRTSSFEVNRLRDLLQS